MSGWVVRLPSPADALLASDRRLADHHQPVYTDLAQGRPEDGYLAAPGAKEPTLPA